MWVLFVLMLQADQYFVRPHGPFLDMDTCFKARETILEQFPQPKLNYEAVCIQTDFFGEGT